MADLDDITGWYEEYQEKLISGQVNDWRVAEGKKPGVNSKRVSTAMAVDLLRLALSDEKLRAAMMLVEKAWSASDKDLTIRETYSESYKDEIYHAETYIAYFFRWYIWKTDNFTRGGGLGEMGTIAKAASLIGWQAVTPETHSTFQRHILTFPRFADKRET